MVFLILEILGSQLGFMLSELFETRGLWQWSCSVRDLGIGY